MSGFGGFDLEESTAQAWTRFQARLGDRLVEMGDDDILVVDVEVAEEDVDGATPYVQFTGFGDGTTLRGEVSGNAYLAEPYTLDGRSVAALTALGWAEPTVAAGEPEGEGSANFFTDLPVGDADRLAVMAVRALREVFGVAHPAFLAAGGLEDDPGAPTPPAEPAVEPEEAPAVMPESADHLCELVDRALTGLFGAPPEHDSDGDVPVPFGSSLVYVRVDQERPVVEVFGFVALDVTDLERAAFEVGVLNRDQRFIKFVLVEDRVLARIHLPAWPFVPEHLRSMLTLMSTTLDEIDEDLVVRVGGRRALDLAEDEDEDEDDPDRDRAAGGGGEAEAADGDDTRSAGDAVTDRGGLGSALLTLLQLDADAVGSVDPELAASICHFDRQLVLRLLGDTGRQEIAWRDARDRAARSGDTGEADACAHEGAAWERTTVLLRQALRLIVERELGRSTATGPGRPTRQTGRSRSEGGHRRVARTRPPTGPSRPPRLCVVEEAGDLMRFHNAADLVELDARLSGQSPCSVEVVDLEDHLTVLVDEEVGRLEYPFTVADFQALLQQLEESALAGRVATDADEA